MEERRARKRPKTGDRTPCPNCAEQMRFFECYRVRLGANAKSEPAWVCKCGHEVFVRRLLMRPSPVPAPQPSKKPRIA